LIGAVAQLGEHLLCKQGVSGSIPLSSTIICPDAVAAHAAALRTGRPVMADELCSVWADYLDVRVVFTAHNRLITAHPLSSEEKQVCITSMKCCLFCKNREEKIDLEASRYGFVPMSEAGPNDVVDGLADRIRKRGRNR
jgi:hypothetical protein